MNAYNSPIPNIPEPKSKRIVIVGAGFAGLKLAQKLSHSDYQVILLDKNNYHMFQPLLYQVATAALPPSSVSFPLRKHFQNIENVVFRMAVVESVDREQKLLMTNMGSLTYDFLVLALGADTNYFGNKNVEKYAAPMKSTSEALFIRNKIISNYETAVNLANEEDRKPIMNIVIVGGGATGVELAGSIAELRNQVLPKDYPQLNFHNMRVILIEAGERLLSGLSEQSSSKSLQYLQKLGVEVKLKTMVENYDGKIVSLKGGEYIKTTTLLWAAGIKANPLKGIDLENYAPNGRIKVDVFNRLLGSDDIFVVGDQSIVIDKELPRGHPQVAQTAIQQASNLARNLLGDLNGKEWKPFKYNDLGSMATVGKKMAVVDLPFVSFYGFFAWMVWLFVHLMQILGVKNKLMIFLNWSWKYLKFDPSLRLLIRPHDIQNLEEESYEEADITG